MRTLSFFRFVLFGLLCFSLTACGLTDVGGGGATRGTKTYTVRGKTYRPYLTADGYRERGRRLVVWQRLPRPQDRQWRALQHVRHDRSA